MTFDWGRVQAEMQEEVRAEVTKAAKLALLEMRSGSPPMADVWVPSGHINAVTEQVREHYPTAKVAQADWNKGYCRLLIYVIPAETEEQGVNDVRTNQVAGRQPSE